ncbi:LysM peptidoglycan-binding domain-containing protein, partial [Micromonospora zhanjiangensis]
MAMTDQLRRQVVAPAPTARRAPVRRPRATALIIALLVGGLLTGALVGSGPAGAVAEPTGKYYVVGQPVNGQREYLYDIARKTLGNGNRYKEIVALNRDRRQPDGALLTDSMDIRPGWVLLLPPDAEGPGGRAGTPTAVAPP